MIIPVGFIQFTMNFGGNGLANPGAVIFGASNTLPMDAQTAATNAAALWSEHIMPVLNDDVQFTGCLAKLGPNSTGQSAFESTADNGGVSSTGATSNVAYLVHKNSSIGGRHGRGRMYLPGVTESSVGSDGSVDSAIRGDIQTAVDAWLSDMDIGNLTVYLLHTDATSPSSVESLTVDARAATQRRRMRR